MPINIVNSKSNEKTFQKELLSKNRFGENYLFSELPPSHFFHNQF